MTMYYGNDPKSSPFRDLLDEDKEIGYFSYLDDQGYSPSRRRQLRNLFGDVQSRYKGAVGSQIRAGGLPTLRFDDFLEGSTGFNFDDFYKDWVATTSQWNRGVSSGMYAPKVRHLLRF